MTKNHPQRGDGHQKDKFSHSSSIESTDKINLLLSIPFIILHIFVHSSKTTLNKSRRGVDFFIDFIDFID